MKQSEIKALSLNEVKEQLTTERNNLVNLQFAHAISPLENPSRIKLTRKTIARLETQLRSLELNG
ncbi:MULTISPECIES: 50S ribosomal protein L29 [Rufibacter]|jgi:large subunit ribosomal protein L29|uniref:Large ribosomal subunit protein uL29 n=3 Tax=Rufibacter TaxID=1379908 RepID=A0A0P0CSP1_9BACT|nr:MULTISPECIES: 50S ribosomal protein L29 [Rufibacter]ALI99505.1 50S ribosomal protein L29 [Rufibacter tibetensis]KAA3436234.1 50S ribosomal protein L29 [Rufibacter hautae]KAA6437305.1 50S ribosomal protein L29 [Rufibacter glacialis]GGK60288.1 50S ribosomal protein L29 [Rufibacter glacialis]